MNCPIGHGSISGYTSGWIGALGSRNARPPRDCRPVEPPPSPDLTRLPSVLAIPLRDYFTEDHPVLRVHRLCDAAEIVTRFLTILALGEVRRMRGDDPLPTRLLRELQPQIQRPTFGHWRRMLEVLTRELRRCNELVVPELPKFAGDRLLPLLPGGQALPDQCLVSLRNELVHGGAKTGALALEYLERWEPELDLLVQRMSFLEDVEVCVIRNGAALRLTGPDVERHPSGAPTGLGAGADVPEGHVVLIRGSKWLDLWPLCCYGRAVAARPQGPRQAETESPMLYFRCESDRLVFAALGVELPRGENFDDLDSFRRLFRLGEREKAAPDRILDFEAEIRADAELLVGRKAQLRAAKEAIKAADTLVLWIGGPGGIGKSFIMAKLAADLGNDPRRVCRLYWRFQLGDAARCNRFAFFRHAIARIAASLSKESVRPAPNPNDLHGQLRDLLDEIEARAVEGPDGRPLRVVFMLDGLDEIARVDEEFLQVPFELNRSSVVWVCAGRPEGVLRQFFSSGTCTHVFPGGLPAMSEEDIRAMLLEGTGSLKYELLELDIEQAGDDGEPDRIINRAVSAVVNRADGLPLYVRFVVQDLRDREFRFDDLEACLPPSLSGYYDMLLHRLSVGEIQALLTPLVATIAWSRAPLDEETLQLLMIRRGALPPGEDGPEKLRRGLDTIQSMIRPAWTPDGQIGFELYHPTFREHIRKDPEGQMGWQNDAARNELCRLAIGWADLDPSHPARRHSLRFGPRTLIEAGRWRDVERVLADTCFIEAKIEADLTFQLIGDLSEAFKHGRHMDLERIAAAFVKVLEEGRRDPFPIQLRSALAQYFEEYPKWPETLRRHLESSDDFGVRRFLGETHDAEYRYERAEAIFRRLRDETDPGDVGRYVAACVKLATAHEHQGRPTDGLRVLAEFAAANARDRFGDYVWWAANQIGIHLLQLRRFEDARAVLEQVVEKTPHHRRAIEARHQLGVIDMNTGHLDRAKERFEACLENRETGDWNVRRAYEYRRLGQVYALMGDVDGAARAFKRAIDISIASGNSRYVGQTREDDRVYRAVHALRERQPQTVDLSELATEFALKEAEVARAFRIVSEHSDGAHEAYVEELDGETLESKGRAVRRLTSRTPTIAATTSSAAVSSRSRASATPSSPSSPCATWSSRPKLPKMSL